MIIPPTIDRGGLVDASSGRTRIFLPFSRRRILLRPPVCRLLPVSLLFRLDCDLAIESSSKALSSRAKNRFNTYDINDPDLELSLLVCLVHYW
jgi:hypothetical protein